MGLIVFVIVLSFLVIIHELGHFITAKWSGMKVEEFGLGYPPKAKTLFTDKAGTEYTINWLPFGGFVRLYGEDGVADKKIKGKSAFFDKPILQRLIVVLAGATVNFLFGVLAFGAIYSYVGIPTEFDYIQVDGVSENSPAAEAGLGEGDKIVGYRVEDELVEVSDVSEFIELISEYRGKTVALVLREVEYPIEVYVRTEEEIPEGQGSMGVVISNFGYVHYPVWQMPFRGMVVGTESAIEFGKLLVVALYDMGKDVVTMGKVPDEVAGPVGIVHAVQREGILEDGLLAIINFAAILSINLAIVNVLPFPALDGGRAMFLVVELVRGKRLEPKIERWFNTIGFLLLITLIVLVSIRDVGRVLQDEAFKTFIRSFTGN